MRFAIAVALVASIGGAMPALGDAGADANFARAAVYCSVLAAESSDLSGNRTQASTLAGMGMDKAREFMKLYAQGLAAGSAGDQGPLGNFLKTVSPDFLMGLTIGGWMSEAEDLLPKAGQSTETLDEYSLRKETLAEIEFGRRNCSLLKP